MKEWKYIMQTLINKKHYQINVLNICYSLNMFLISVPGPSLNPQEYAQLEMLIRTKRQWTALDRKESPANELQMNASATFLQGHNLKWQKSWHWWAAVNIAATTRQLEFGFTSPASSFLHPHYCARPIQITASSPELTSFSSFRERKVHVS